MLKINIKEITKIIIFILIILLLLYLFPIEQDFKWNDYLFYIFSAIIIEGMVIYCIQKIMKKTHTQ